MHQCALELEAFFNSLHPRGRSKFVVMLEMYLDESGWTQSSVCVMAGYIASSSQWIKLANAWEQIRVEEKAPVFHAGRFFNTEAFKHDYPGWTRARGWEYLSKLIEVARNCRMSEINAAVRSSLFKSLNVEMRRFLTGGQLRWYGKGGKWSKSGGPSHAYYTCFITCLMRALSKTPGHLVLNLYMDEQKQLAPYALVIHKQFQESFAATHQIGEIAFSERKNRPPLQLADMIAYLRFQEATSKLRWYEENALAGLVELRKDRLAYVEQKTIDAILKTQEDPIQKFLNV